MKTAEFYRLQVRHYQPFESHSIYTDSQVVFDTLENMNKYIDSFKPRTCKVLAQSELVQFNKNGILSCKKVIKNYLTDNDNDNEQEE